MIKMMTESEEFVPYATKFSKNAMAGLRALPVEAQQALTEVIAALAEDPDKFPHRSRINPEDGRSFLYTHPEPPLKVTYELDREQQVIYFLHFAAPELQYRKPLFISYSHVDKVWLDRLLKWLPNLDEELIDIWVDRKIEPGANYEEEIERALSSAKAAVLLVTQDFIASDFIKRVELPALLKAAESGKLTLMWVAVSHAAIEETPLHEHKTQAVNDPKRPLKGLRGAKRDEAFLRIHDAIKRALTS